MSDNSRVGQEEAYNRIAQILGCKWSIAILDCVDRGLNRPGKIEKELPGLSAKVLHRCMNRLEKDGILGKTVFQEVPPRVEYTLTEMGMRFFALVGTARELATNWTGVGPYVR